MAGEPAETRGYGLSDLPTEPPDDRSALSSRTGAVSMGQFFHDLAAELRTERYPRDRPVKQTLLDAWLGYKITQLREALVNLATLPERLMDSARIYSETGIYNPAPFVEAGTMVVGGPMPFAMKGALGSSGGKISSVPIGKYAKYADEYPPVGTPRLQDKVTGKEIQYSSRADAEKLVAEGKARFRKNLPPETQEFARARRAVQRHMDENGYPHYFDLAKRADVDPRNYPGWRNMMIEAWPKRLETQQRIRDAYLTKETNQRLVAAFNKGIVKPNSDKILSLRKIEDKYIERFGPELGRHLFRMEFAGPIAATTAGLAPTPNLLMAHFAARQHKLGLPLPKHAADVPYPIGGPFVRRNLQSAQAFRDAGTGTFSASSPKSHEYLYGMLGHPGGHIVDRRVAPLIVPAMRVPRHYGPAAEAMSIAQNTVGARNARDFGDPTWVAAGKSGHDEGPLISTANGIIERTHLLTGWPRDKVVELGFLDKQIPLYGVGGAMLAPTIGYGLSELPNNGD